VPLAQLQQPLRQSFFMKLCQTRAQNNFVDESLRRGRSCKRAASPASPCPLLSLPPVGPVGRWRSEVTGDEVAYLGRDGGGSGAQAEELQGAARRGWTDHRGTPTEDLGAGGGRVRLGGGGAWRGGGRRSWRGQALARRIGGQRIPRCVRGRGAAGG
jgi:hypothetical protein